jgi:truncated hemoglobin YjbI
VSLYDDIGGEEPIRAVLQTLYDQLFEDVMVGFLFAGKDKRHLVEQQVRFTARFLGGPARYDGKPLPEAHASLPLLPGHFDRRHHLLELALAAHGVAPPVAARWLEIDESLRTSVLASGADARDLARKPEGA